MDLQSVVSLWTRFEGISPDHAFQSFCATQFVNKCESDCEYVSTEDYQRICWKS